VRSQPTLGRTIKQLEQSRGATLFIRAAGGMHLSETGAQILPHVREMHTAMNAATLSAAGQMHELAGTVRITASIFASHYVLPPILAEIRAAEPRIELVLLPSDATENLLFREADIAVRMYRPEQLDIVARHVTDAPLGVFAARRYLERAGRPKSAEDLRAHALIGYESNDLILRTMREMGWHATIHTFAMRCDNQSAYWELLRAGCGIGFSHVSVGRADSLVEELDLGLKIPSLPIWLAAHAALRQTPRIRRVWDYLADGLMKSVRA